MVGQLTAHDVVLDVGHHDELGVALREQLASAHRGLVQAVRDAKPSLALFLSGANLISLEGHVLKLGFGADDRFAMTLVIKNRENIEQICAEKLGQRVRLEGVVQQDGGTAEQKEEAPPPESDPTVRSVLDTFDGELV